MSVAAGNKNHLIRLIAVVLTGILAGLSGMVLALILHAIQHLAFGYSYGQIVGSVSFLQGVTESSWPRRIVAIVAARRRRIWLVAAWSLWAEAGFHCGGGGQPLRTHARGHHDDPRAAADRHSSAGLPAWPRSGAPGNGRAGGGDGGA